MDTQEKKIETQLAAKFPYLQGRIRMQRQRRLYAETTQENFEEVLLYAKQDLGFKFLCTITGLDDGQVLSFIYHLTRQDGMVLSIKISVPREKPVIKTVINYFRGAEIYERELVDLLGAKVEGLPEGKRYPLPDNWPKDQYPLRKDWKQHA